MCAVETQSTWSDGWVVGTGNLFPKENSTVYQLAAARRTEEAMKAQQELIWPYLPLFTEGTLTATFCGSRSSRRA